MPLASRLVEKVHVDQSRKPAVFFRIYMRMRVRKWAGEGRKNTSGQTCQVFVARAQDPEPANQIATTRKLLVNCGFTS